ncbi:hypothetical protein V0U79_12965 [Hyphobacterium sp. HN65]|uniref:Uncharacterized protein n=1 Tax=Hyphobacterium lacteum TaxID=3116575 RepID=A0ABU7LTL5_9PROT|nr:hypothetical protein [Hyphobacterium sp. HN65]MEE2527270.1 hypothetical protein [Hyphobacterium sp. HN65]
MLALMMAALLQAQAQDVICETDLNIPTGRRRHDPKTFTVECPDYGLRYEGMQEQIEAHFDALDLDFRHADWTRWPTRVRFRLDPERGWIPDGPQMMIISPPEMPRSITNSGYRDLECIWMAYPEADGVVEVEDYRCLLDGEAVPERMERRVRRVFEQAMETSRIMPETPGACVQDVVRVSAFVFDYHYAFGWDGDGPRRSANSRFDPLCPPGGIDAAPDSDDGKQG